MNSYGLNTDLKALRRSGAAGVDRYVGPLALRPSLEDSLERPSKPLVGPAFELRASWAVRASW